MTTLSETDLLKIWRGLMRYWSRVREPVAFVKNDLYTAIVDLDTWVDNNAAVVNNALPLPFRTSATAEQKSIVFAAIVLARYNPELLCDIFGEVN